MAFVKIVIVLNRSARQRCFKNDLFEKRENSFEVKNDVVLNYWEEEFDINHNIQISDILVTVDL